MAEEKKKKLKGIAGDSPRGITSGGLANFISHEIEIKLRLKSLTRMPPAKNDIYE